MRAIWRPAGHNRLLCVEAHNTPSIAAGLRSGYAPIGWSGWLRGRNGVRAWYSRAAAGEGTRFYTP